MGPAAACRPRGVLLLAAPPARKVPSPLALPYPAPLPEGLLETCRPSPQPRPMVLPAVLPPVCAPQLCHWVITYTIIYPLLHRPLPHPAPALIRRAVSSGQESGARIQTPGPSCTPAGGPGRGFPGVRASSGKWGWLQRRPRWGAVRTARSAAGPALRASLMHPRFPDGPGLWLQGRAQVTFWPRPAPAQPRAWPVQ